MPFFRVTNYFVSTFYTEAPSATEALSEVESGELDADERKAWQWSPIGRGMRAHKCMTRLCNLGDYQ